MSLSLDGNISYIGTEFIKLLNTGSSDLATEEYVLEQVALGGGGGVQPENVYTKAETDGLLNNKLNVNNPQDILGNLRLDPTNGLSKIILNAVNAPNDEDLYVNGSAYVNNGELRAQSMKCDNTLTFATIKGNFISNNDANTDLKFQINTNDFITLSTANDVIEVDKDIEMHSSTLKSDVLDTWSNASLQIRRNGINYLSLESDDTISISRQSKIGSNKADGVVMTVSHYNNTTNLFEKKLTFKNGNEIYATGDGGVDEELLLNYHTDAGVRIGNATDAYLTIKGVRNGTDTLTVNGSTYFGGAVSYNGDIVLTDPYVLKTNKVSSNTLADLVFEIDTVGEWFRCQASDFTVRLPNNRSFLAQNITVDNLQPLSFGNDLILNGGNNTDAYEEYIRLDASTDKVIVSKLIDTSEDIILLQNKKLYLDDTVNKNRYIRSSYRASPPIEQLDIINETSGGRIRLILDANGSTTTDEQFIVENTGITCRRILKAGQGLNTNTINTNTDIDLTISRNGNEFLRLDKDDDNIVCSKEIVAGNAVIVDTAKKLTMKPSLESGINIFDIRNLHPVVDNPMIRFRVGEGTGETIVCEMRNEGITIARNMTIGTAYQLKTNTINSNGDNDLVFQRNGTPYLTLDKFTEDVNGTPTEREAIILSKQLRANAQIRVNNLQINQFSSGVQYADIRLENIDSVMRFYVGNGTNANIQMTNTSIELRRETTISGVKTNTIDTATDSDLIVRRNGTTFLTLDDVDGVKASQSITVEGANDYVYTNNIRHNTGTNLNIWSLDTIKFLSSAVNQMEIKQTQIDFNDDIFVADGKGTRVPEIFTYNYDTYTVQGVTGDVIWAYNNTPYMFYDASEGKFSFMVDVISNFEFSGTAFNVVSDEQKKENIENVDEDCSEIVKSIEVKTFNYKEDKKKRSNIGFIAQDVHKKVPTKFETVVSDSGEFMGIDYGKMSAILWRALQEQMEIISKLESRLFEAEDEIKALKGKGKAKSKAKSKNVD